MTTDMSSYRLIDIGANLTHESFQHDLTQVLERATAAGVGAIVVTGASQHGSEQALQLAEQHPQLYATAGVHPHEAAHYSDSIHTRLQQLATHPRVLAVGECGLDFYRDLSPRPAQEHCFARQLELACANGKSVFMHERDAHDRFVAILGQYINDLPKTVLHCFTGTESQLQAYLELGCHIGITGWICDERRGHHLREFIGAIPADRLMLETDAPYLLPRDLRPKPATRRNEPCYLPHILATVAAAVGKPPAQVAAETTANAQAFFNIK
jgi:TatD DNase family protein